MALPVCCLTFRLLPLKLSLFMQSVQLCPLRLTAVGGKDRMVVAAAQSVLKHARRKSTASTLSKR